MHSTLYRASSTITIIEFSRKLKSSDLLKIQATIVEQSTDEFDSIGRNKSARKNKPLTTRKFLCVVDSDVIEVKGITIEESSKRNQYV